LGHQVVFLVGDFTAMIGDTSDKEAERPMLAHEQVLENLKSYTDQAGKLLDLNKVEVVYNSHWLDKLTFREISEQADIFSVNDFISRSNIKDRLDKGGRVSLREMMYPMMQGYDSVKLGVEAEIGGNDQTFNMLMGRTMAKRLGREKFVITVKLLTDPTGKKMGKTEGNMVTLADNPNEMYGKVMSWSDTMIMSGFEICTALPLTDLAQSCQQNPRDAKMALAKELVRIYHGPEAATTAETYFIDTFQRQAIPEEILTVSASAGDLLADILVAAKLVDSKSDFKRLVLGRGIGLESGEPVLDPFHKVSHTAVFKIGKKRFIKVEVRQVV
ncbi:MAG: tyrosine--tRNA ligase, partial [Patescibacteria group bacterium]